MATTMQAAVVRALGAPLAIEEVAIPTPGPDGVLVRIVATGVCHTDLHAAKGGWPVKPKPPFIPGHESVGHVAAVGSAVHTLKEGDHVGIPWLHSACGSCSYCRTGWETLAKAMGMHVAAIDLHAEKLALARRLGADLVLDAREDLGAALQDHIGGVHGVLVTAVSPAAFEQAFAMLRPRGTMALVGLPSGRFALPIFDTVLKRITVRGSIVGTRRDLDEALAFSAEGKVAPHFHWDALGNINAIFARMERGEIDGRIVLDLGGTAPSGRESEDARRVAEPAVR